MTRPTSLRLGSPPALWVWVLSAASVAGWTLSLAHELNAGGYLVVAVVFGVVFFVVWRKQKGGEPPKGGTRYCRWRWRFRQPIPLCYLVLAVMACLGGVLYPPSNYDALAYCTPRVLHWLSEGQWHWIHTEFQRLNVRGCGFEWAIAPLLAWFKTDRLVFVINAVTFALLPGMFFGVFRVLGVRGGERHGRGCGFSRGRMDCCFRPEREQ